MQCPQLVLLLFAIHSLASTLAYSSSDRVEHSKVDLGDMNTTASDAKNVDNAVNTPTSSKKTDQIEKNKPEERLPVSFKWLEELSSALASSSLSPSPSSESLPWSESTHSTGTFSRSASTLSTRGAYSRSTSALSSDADDEINNLVNQWIREKQSLHSVRQILGMDDLPGYMYASSPYFRYYDKFASAQVQIWVQEDWSLDDVISYLSLQYLPADKLKADPDFKYLTEFLDGQIAAWSIQDLSVDDVREQLHLTRREKSAEAIQEVTNDYYREYVSARLHAWFEDGEEVSYVMTRLGLDGLTGEKLERHRNYRAYKHFVEKKLRLWADLDYSVETVQEKLGGADYQYIPPDHPNFPFMIKYLDNKYEYRIENWLSKETPTLAVWKLLKIRNAFQTTIFEYKLYERYVMALDQHIIQRFGYDVPHKFNSEFDEQEMYAKTKVWAKNSMPEEYVLSSMGLEGLTDDEMRKTPVFKCYTYYYNKMTVVP